MKTIICRKLGQCISLAYIVVYFIRKQMKSFDTELE
jgi:hypothetical protein